MSDESIDLRIKLLLSELRLPTIRCAYAKVAMEVSVAVGDFRAFLHALLEEEIEERRKRRSQRRIKEARFRQEELLSELEPSELPKTVSIEHLNELASGEYLDRAANIIAIGNSGTGKAHVCTGLAMAACQ